MALPSPREIVAASSGGTRARRVLVFGDRDTNDSPVGRVKSSEHAVAASHGDNSLPESREYMHGNRRRNALECTIHAPIRHHFAPAGRPAQAVMNPERPAHRSATVQAVSENGGFLQGIVASTRTSRGGEQKRLCFWLVAGQL